HLAVALIQRLAIVGVQTQAHLRAIARKYFAEPVRVGQCLARETDNVSLLLNEAAFCLLEVMDDARHDHGGLETPFSYGCAYSSGGPQVSPKGSRRVGVVGGHAFISAAAGVGIRGLTDLGLFGIIELPAA